jgi:phospholipid-translocating ATPase
MTLFYFNWFCLFTATSMHDSMTIFLTNFFFLVPNALILGLVDEPTYRAVNHYLPALYADGQVRKKYFLVFFLFHSFIEGFVQAACVFYSTVFLIQFSTNLDGHTGDLQMMSTIIIYSILSNECCVS